MSPHRSSLSRFLADVDRPCLEAFRTLFEQQSEASRWISETIGGIFDRQGRRYLVFDVDATRQAARQCVLPCDPTLPADAGERVSTLGASPASARAGSPDRLSPLFSLRSSVSLHVLDSHFVAFSDRRSSKEV